VEEADKDNALKVEALRCATTLHCSVAANTAMAPMKPADVVTTAKVIYAWLKG
jgi:hypothetical protein